MSSKDDLNLIIESLNPGDIKFGYIVDVSGIRKLVNALIDFDRLCYYFKNF